MQASQVDILVTGCQSNVEKGIAKIQSEVRLLKEKKTEDQQTIAVLPSDYAAIMKCYGDQIRKWQESVDIKYNSDTRSVEVRGTRNKVNSCIEEITACFHALKKMNQRRISKKEPNLDQIVDFAKSNPNVYIVNDDFNEYIDIYANSPDDLTEIDKILHHMKGPEGQTESATACSAVQTNQQAQHSTPCPSAIYQLKGLTVHCYPADILKIQVQCIVNAANKDLDHGGGIAHAISSAAGKRFQDACTQFVRNSKFSYIKSFICIQKFGSFVLILSVISC